MAILALHLEDLGLYKPAATLGSWAARFPSSLLVIPESSGMMTRLRAELSDAQFGACAETAENMSATEIGRYALEQIAELRNAWVMANGQPPADTAQ